MSGWVGLGVILGFVSLFNIEIIGPGLMIGAPCLGWLIYVRHYNTNIWPPLYAEWDRKYICDRCGAVFIPT